ncbi:S8 family serine peptidase [Coralliovum pocilloporae]|uniref:S8 family serine peptidase n=1 Tax=Coralliovum pocilloporae TaxID=3066369 RepID=UPI0033072737
MTGTKHLWRMTAALGLSLALIVPSLPTPAQANPASGHTSGGGSKTDVGAAIFLGIQAGKIIYDAVKEKNKKKTKKTTKTKPKKKKTKRVTRSKKQPKKATVKRTSKTPAKRQTAKRSAPPKQFASGMPPETEDRYIDNEVIVRYRIGASQRQMNALVGRLKLQWRSARTFRLAGTTVHRYRINNDTPVRDVIAALEQDPTVASAQPNYLYSLQQAAGNAANSAQYALAKLSISPVHSITRGGAVPIAVIDSGIDMKHPELKATSIEAIDTTGEKKHQADAHGTSIAGIIASNGTLLGIAPESRLIGIRAFLKDKTTGLSTSSSWAIATALDRAHKAGARVINMSFAGPKDPLVGDSIRSAIDKGLIPVAAAGNDGPESQPLYPAAYEGVIAVTATDKDDSAYSKANRGDYITVAAPGVDILAPIPNGGYSVSSGTSMAAAHVSGLIALVLSRDSDLGYDDILKVLSTSSTDLGKPGRDPVFGTGLPSAAQALNKL